MYLCDCDSLLKRFEYNSLDVYYRRMRLPARNLGGSTNFIRLFEARMNEHGSVPYAPIINYFSLLFSVEIKSNFFFAQGQYNRRLDSNVVTLIYYIHTIIKWKHKKIAIVFFCISYRNILEYLQVLFPKYLYTHIRIESLCL